MSTHIVYSQWCNRTTLAITSEDLIGEVDNLPARGSTCPAWAQMLANELWTKLLIEFGL